MKSRFICLFVVCASVLCSGSAFAEENESTNTNASESEDLANNTNVSESEDLANNTNAGESEDLAKEYKFGVRLDASFISFLGDEHPGPLLGFKGSFLYNYSDEWSVDTGLTWYIPDSTETTDTTLVSFEAMAHYLIVGTTQTLFGWHAGVGAALQFGNQTISIHNVTRSFDSDVSYSGVDILVGTGAHYRLGALQLRGDLIIGVPATEVNGKAVEVAFPPHVALQLGAAYLF